MKKKLLCILLVCIFVLLSGSCVFAETDYVWNKAADISGRNLLAITYGKGIFVAVGQFGRIETSEDGRNWTPRETGTRDTLSDVIWNGSIFVAVGSSRTVLTSADGIQWEKRNSELNTSGLVSIAWNGRSFAASSGFYGVMITSADGINWTKHHRTLTYEHAGHRSIIWDGTRYLALDTSGVGTGSSTAINTSKDGIDWERIAVQGLDKEFRASSLAYNGKIYIMVPGTGNAVYISKDAVSWSKKELPTNFDAINKVVWEGGQFIAVGGVDYAKNSEDKRGVIFTSADGEKWERQSKITNHAFTDIAYNGEVYVAVTYSDPRVGIEHVGLVYVSKDSKKWEKIFMGTLAGFESVASNGKTTVAVGDHGIIYTTNDGVKWIRATATGSWIGKVIWDGKRFIAAGIEFLVSEDGLNWRKEKIKVDSSKLPAAAKALQVTKAGELEVRISDIHWNGKTYVAVGELGLVMTSADAKSWVMRDSKVNKWIRSIVWNGKRYIADTNDPLAKILVSDNGVNWTVIDLGENVHSDRIACNGTKAVMICHSNKGEVTTPGKFVSLYKYKQYVYVSEDGIKWQKKDLGSYNPYFSIDWTGSEFILTTFNEVFVSKDAEAWVNILPDPAYGFSMKDVIKVNDRYFAVGGAGDIMDFYRELAWWGGSIITIENLHHRPIPL